MHHGFVCSCVQHTLESLCLCAMCALWPGQKAPYSALFILYGAVHSSKTKWSCNRVNEKQQRMPDKTCAKWKKKTPSHGDKKHPLYIEILIKNSWRELYHLSSHASHSFSRFKKKRSFFSYAFIFHYIIMMYTPSTLNILPVCSWFLIIIRRSKTTIMQ